MLRLWDVVYDFLPSEAEMRIEERCALACASVDGQWSRTEFEEHVRDEHLPFSWILELMIERCDFDIIDIERTPETIDSKYVLRAR